MIFFSLEDCLHPSQWFLSDSIYKKWDYTVNGNGHPKIAIQVGGSVLANNANVEEEIDPILLVL
jgi:hypothetical protein